MKYYSGIPRSRNWVQPYFVIDRDSAFDLFAKFIADTRSYGEAARPPLTARAVTKEILNLTEPDGKAANLFISVQLMLAVNAEGRVLLERFAPGTCSYWPVRLFDKNGQPFGGSYMLVHTMQAIAAEYALDEKKLWWGHKIGGRWCLRGYESDVFPDLFGPIMRDWRPIIKNESAKLSLAEVGDAHIWKTFVFGYERYYFSEEFAQAILDGAPMQPLREMKTVKKKWLPEEQMRPLLEWLEAKDERKLEWCGRYPRWVQKHRPEWFKLGEGR